MSNTKQLSFIDNRSTSKSSKLVQEKNNQQLASSCEEATAKPSGNAPSSLLVEKGPLPKRHDIGKGPTPFRKTHFHTKRTLLRIGVLLAILIVLILIVKALSTTFGNEDVTAFRVGAPTSVPLYIGGGGIIYPRQQIPVSYAAAGNITNVIVKVGDQVQVGQPLIRLDQSQVKAQINLAANTVAAAQAYLNSVSNASPYNPVTVANAQQQLQLAQNRYDSLTSQSSNTLHDGNLVAPATGIVSAINVTPGQNFTAQAVLLTLIDPSIVTVHTEIPLENLTQVHNGMSAIVNPSALPDKSLTGKVTSIVPQANPQTDTFEAYIEIANPQQELLPGMSAFVRIQSQTNALVVPRLAVLNPDRESAVFQIRNNHAYITNVHVIGHADNSIYVDQGLSPNDVIVLLPLNRMREGQHVNVTHLEHAPNGAPS
jgi:RND family efflux transporter MFP subunit